MKKNCVEAAVAYFGGKTKLANAMDTTVQNVYNWSVKGTFPPANALQVERVSNGAIKARDILIENETSN